MPLPTWLPQLERRLAEGQLPGQAAQYAMASKLRHLPESYELPDTLRHAGVLALLYPKGADWHLAYIQRPAPVHSDDRHGGQISFPGGKHEVGDSDYGHTALRETEEEIGVPGTQVRLLGALTELFIPVSSYLVHPFVGIAETAPRFVPQPEEVAEVLEIPLHWLQDERRRKHTDIRIHAGLTLREVPYFDLEGRVLWGATAMMTNELLAILPPGT